MDANVILEYVELWQSRGYKSGIPDEAPEVFEKENMAPSYRLVCLAIMKNDEQLQTLGHSRKPCRIYNCLKREELRQRGKIKHSQMRLFE